MAVNVVFGFLFPLGENETTVTQLLGDTSVRFTKANYNLAVSESISPGPLLQLTVKVSTPDVQLHFDILLGNDGNLFRVDHSTGLLSLVSPLDYETAKKHILVVQVSFRDDSSQSKVFVEVLDANDHAPIFSRDRHETQITEEDDRHLPKKIMTIKATDEDKGPFGHLKYFICKNKNYENVSKKFRINEESGDIFLLKPLDRDPPEGQSKWEFDILASDGQLNTTTTVIVNVKDVNDNSPYFPDVQSTAYVSENRPEGTLVTTARALDNDDLTEGFNAKVVYSLEKNVIDESSGRPIFSVDSQSGRIETALCCLDREKTENYAIQVVATDGGGMKGTGTIMVNISDENDVPPKFSRSEWYLDIKEELEPKEVLASLNVIDPDIVNEFQYRIVPNSGRGWDQFFLTNNNGTGCNLHSKIKLDFENPEHRRGFKFKIQVCDTGTEGWQDKYHIDAAWVNIKLLDVNDNMPTYLKTAHYKKIVEDAPPGTSLVTVKATDADGGGGGHVNYIIDPRSDPDRLFETDVNGVIKISKPLDREKARSHRLVIYAEDKGEPVRTATATLVIDVTDINDNPPHFNCPTLVRLNEGSKPQIVANLTLDDPDDWSKGHGPPFTLFLDPRAPTHIKKAVKVEFNSEGNNGIGTGTVKTTIPLDREERRNMLLPIVVSDGAKVRQTATLTLTVAIQDVNDNKMTSANKDVIAYVLQPGVPPSPSAPHQLNAKVPLGRIFVVDPDDWDSKFKEFKWEHPNSFFVLNENDGSIFMEAWTPPGFYKLQFLVSDYSHNQRDVRANISVDVRSLNMNDLQYIVPIVLEHDTRMLIKEDKNGRSMLGSLTNKIKSWILSPNKSDKSDATSKESVSLVSIQELKPKEGMSKKKETLSRIWITSPSAVNLEHILLYRKHEMENFLGIRVISVGSDECGEKMNCKSGCWMRTEVRNGYALIDANSSSIVGPDLHPTSGCGCSPAVIKATQDPFDPRPVIMESKEELCGGNFCLNGGRCLPNKETPRCICPEGTFGPRCKIKERQFLGDEVNSRKRRDKRNGDGSWIWLPTLPSCAEVHLSLQILTSEPDAVLIFSGNSFISVTPEFENFQKAKRQTYFRGGVLPRVKRDSELSVNFSSFNVSDFKETLKKSNLKNVCSDAKSNSTCLYRNVSSVRKIRHMKSNFRKLNRDQNRSNQDQSVTYETNTKHSNLSLPIERLSRGKSLFREKESNSTKIFMENKKNLKINLLPNSSINFNNRSRTRRNRPQETGDPKQDFILLFLKNGRPQLLLNLGGGNIALSLASSESLSDNRWHQIDIIWRDRLVEMIVDICSGDGVDKIYHPRPEVVDNTGKKTPISGTNPPDALKCRVAAPLPNGGNLFNYKGPMQVGGLSSSTLDRRSNLRAFKSFKGCIKNIRINGKIQDLGHGVLSSNSNPGCKSLNCNSVRKTCGRNGQCVGSPNSERCECLPGWAGETCSDKTYPATLKENSFITLALSFAPISFSTTLQMRLRTRQGDGELISLSSPHGKDKLSLSVERGSLCLFLRLHPETPTTICLSKFKVNDGNWHLVKAIRVGSGVILSIDEGDGKHFNSSLLLDGRPLLQLSRQDGLHIGGTPEYLNGRVVKVHRDFFNGCIDDLRLQGRTLPLPPTVNSTRWGQVTTFRNVRSDCRAAKTCFNVSCQFPLSCIDTWESYHCGCMEGFELSYGGNACEDQNECDWNPCLNGGSCFNKVPGYTCSCPIQLSGLNCEVRDTDSSSMSLSLVLLTLAVTLSLVVILLVFLGVVFYQRKRKQKNRKNSSTRTSELDFQLKENNLMAFKSTPELSTADIMLPPWDDTNARPPKHILNVIDVDVIKVETSINLQDPNSRFNKCITVSPEDLHHLHNIGQPKLKTFKDKRSELEVINTYKETIKC